jgi:hypothetical protein
MGRFDGARQRIARQSAGGEGEPQIVRNGIDQEAGTLLLSIDPLAALAETQQALHDRLKEVAPTPPPELLAAWQAEAEAALTKFARPNGLGDSEKALQLSEQFLILITCRDEKQQVELLGRFQGGGLECKELVG